MADQLDEPVTTTKDRVGGIIAKLDAQDRTHAVFVSIRTLG